MNTLFREFPVEYDNNGLILCPLCACNMIEPIASKIGSDETEMEVKKQKNSLVISNTEKTILKFRCVGCVEGWFPAKQEERDIHYLVIAFKKGNTRMYWREKKRNYENVIIEYNSF
jgi:hypothetical protein